MDVTASLVLTQSPERDLHPQDALVQTSMAELPVALLRPERRTLVGSLA